MNWYLEVLKKYATFSGRASRSEFWYFTLINSIISIGIIFLAVLAVDNNSYDIANVLIIIFYIYGIATLLPSISVIVRRLHDIGKSGWWYFIVIIPIVGPLILLYFMILDSTPGDNVYGANPKGIKASTTSEVNPTGEYASVTERVKDNNQHAIKLKPNNSIYPIILLNENSTITIGRNASYSINNQYVSSKHLEVSQRDGQVIVKDLNSSNGTYIQGVKLDPNKFYTIKNGDKIILGSEEVVYELKYE